MPAAKPAPMGLPRKQDVRLFLFRQYIDGKKCTEGLAARCRAAVPCISMLVEQSGYSKGLGHNIRCNTTVASSAHGTSIVGPGYTSVHSGLLLTHRAALSQAHSGVNQYNATLAVHPFNASQAWYGLPLSPAALAVTAQQALCPANKQQIIP